MVARRDFDLFVIGAGSGGAAGARRAARHGARVGIAEAGAVGGTCVNRGCIPKKLFLYAAEFTDHFDAAPGYGWERPLSGFDWPTLVANKDTEIARLNGVYEGLLSNANVELVRGHARLAGPNAVEVGNRLITADRILVATGGAPAVPDIPGVELGITSDQAFRLSQMPDRIVILGGGYIGVEFAGMFRGLGVEVTLVHRGDALLPGFDHDVRSHVAAEMLKHGIVLTFGRTIVRIDRHGRALAVTLDDGAVIAADAGLFATGRSPGTAELALAAAGVELTGAGAIRVDADSRTSAENIFAVGDVTDRRNLTPIAIAEGRAVADYLFAEGHRRLDYDLVPHAVFGRPPAAAVGLTEARARERFAQVDIYRSTFRPLRNTLSGAQGRTLVKLVVDRASDRVLGAHMVGPDAAEVIQGLAVALTAGATKAHFDATLAIHPTAAEEFVLLREPANPAVAKA